MRYRIVFLVGLGTGYVLGARAGRERYEQIVAAAQRVRGNPAMQQAAGTVTDRASQWRHTAAESGKAMAGRMGDVVAGHLPQKVSERISATSERLRHPSGGGVFFAHRSGHNGSGADKADDYTFRSGQPDDPA